MNKFSLPKFSTDHSINSTHLKIQIPGINTNSILHQIKQYGKDEIADGRLTKLSKNQIESLCTILTNILSAGDRPTSNDIHHLIVEKFK